MKFPISWIAEYVDLPESPEAVASAFTLSGSEVEGSETVEGETILDIGFTVNRPDCMNVYGLAREAAALFESPARPVAVECLEGSEDIGDAASVTIEAEDLCPRYVARHIRGVSVGDSPEWMQKRLIQCGLRPINAVVDVTNYVLLELGHPLHAFDMDTLDDRRIVVRRGAAGERILTLDGEDRALSQDMLVIADGRKPVALAGIMGDETTGVTRETREILLEGAVFDPVSVRRTSKNLGMHTDASHRFERGVDSEGPVSALDRAAKLILDICGGELSKGRIDAHPRPRERHRLTLRVPRVASLLGISVPPERCASILERLGFDVLSGEGETLDVTVPTHRVDITREADLIEEVARIGVLGTLEGTLPAMVDPEAGVPAAQRLEEAIRDDLAASGFCEAIHMSMSDPSLEAILGSDVEPARLTNPLAERASALRTRLLGPLVGAVARNRARGQRSMALFEIGRVYLPEGGGIREESRLAVLLYEDDPPKRWGENGGSGALRLKGAVEGCLHAAGLPPAFRFEDTPPFLEGQCLSVSVGGRVIGYAGSVDPARIEPLDLPGGDLHLAEIVLEGLSSSRCRPAFEPLSRFPDVTRDFSFLLPAAVNWSELESTVVSLELPNLRSLSLVEMYEGKGIPKGKRSWTFSLAFQSNERTLTDEDVQPLVARVIGGLGERLQAVQR